MMEMIVKVLVYHVQELVPTHGEAMVTVMKGVIIKYVNMTGETAKNVQINVSSTG
jgi:hypothetical protein